MNRSLAQSPSLAILHYRVMLIQLLYIQGDADNTSSSNPQNISLKKNKYQQSGLKQYD